jgi:uncharacterized protein (DUF2249 family)
MPQETVSDASANVSLIEAIRGHHAQLAEELASRTKAVLAAAVDGDWAGTRDRLHDWYRAELMPHIVAEEQALYSRGGDVQATALLVLGMLAEHRALVAMIADLALAQRPSDVVPVAASAQALFTVHLEKENELLLPALDDAGVDLGAALAGMHDLLGSAQAQAAGCGCGCDHEHAEVTTVQLTAAPAEFPPPVAPKVPAAAGPGELDVRALPHGQRHEIIFGRLDALAAGEALIIVNDHDPKPLRYQTEALWPGRYEWTYLASGPQVWRLSIRRAG